MTRQITTSTMTRTERLKRELHDKQRALVEASLIAVPPASTRSTHRRWAV
jgi:hypothetical protein